ncbi:MAG TPA: sulfotransferase [Tepidisphaeraceae bacterium]|nr:sulfotransferase [Tepidisphaeraceae bacterium]
MSQQRNPNGKVSHQATADQSAFEYSLGGWGPAPAVVRQAEIQHQADQLFGLAMADWMAGNFHQVGSRLQEVLRLTPENAKAHATLGQWFCDAEDYDRALLHTQRAVELAPRDAEITIARAVVLERSGQPEVAWRLVEPLLAAGLVSYPLALAYGRLACVVKREREALAYIEPFLQSPKLKEFEKAPLCFIAGTLLDRLGQHDRAFGLVRRAKEARLRPYDAERAKCWIDRAIHYFTPSRLRSLPRASHGNRRPVFIVGMPRSGTSLVEQILASHPEVYGAGELKTLSGIVGAMPETSWAGGRLYPESLDAISTAAANDLAGIYLSAIAALNGTARYVTDKNPLNFLDLGLITMLFPGCHVIHCVRDPLDTCVSCYMTLFGLNGSGLENFTQTLSSLGMAYCDYRRLMAHWKAVLDCSLLEVSYEEVVNDLEGQTRRMLEFLGLPWDEQCLKYYDNQRRVMTPSRDQVRRPVYASSIGRWKRYEKYLSELRALLGPG